MPGQAAGFERENGAARRCGWRSAKPCAARRSAPAQSTRIAPRPSPVSSRKISNTYQTLARGTRWASVSRPAAQATKIPIPASARSFAAGRAAKCCRMPRPSAPTSSRNGVPSTMPQIPLFSNAVPRRVPCASRISVLVASHSWTPTTSSQESARKRSGGASRIQERGSSRSSFPIAKIPKSSAVAACSTLCHQVPRPPSRSRSSSRLRVQEKPPPSWSMK